MAFICSVTFIANSGHLLQHEANFSSGLSRLTADEQKDAKKIVTLLKSKLDARGEHLISRSPLECITDFIARVRKFDAVQLPARRAERPLDRNGNSVNTDRRPSKKNQRQKTRSLRLRKQAKQHNAIDTFVSFCQMLPDDSAYYDLFVSTQIISAKL